MRFYSIKAEWRNSESFAWVSEAWNTGFKSVMTEVSFRRTSWNASSDQGFSFSAFHECFGQRCTDWTDQLSHLTSRGGQQNPSPIRPNALSVNTGNAPHVEAQLPNPHLSHRLAPQSHRSSINLLAVQPSGGHLHARTRKLLPQKVTSWVPCTRAQVWHHSAPLCLITQTQPRSSRRLEFNHDETKRVHACTRAVTGPKGLGHNVWLGLQSRAVHHISLLLKTRSFNETYPVNLCTYTEDHVLFLEGLLCNFPME